MIKRGRPPHSIVIVADGDSRVKWAEALAQGIRANLPCPDAYGIEIIKLSAQNAIKHLFVHKAYDMSVCHFLIMGYGGGANLSFSKGFFDFYTKAGGTFRPILIAGFNGICDPMDPHPLLCRSSADLILANSPEDLSWFRAWFSDLGMDAAERLMLLGYLPEDQTRRSAERIDREKTKSRPRIVFFAQPTVPETMKERLYLLRRLNQLAFQNPDWDIVVKPRSGRYARDITHSEKYYYQDLQKSFLKKVSANFSFSHENVDSLLEETDLCLTVGSTVAITAIRKGIPTLIISDFGIRRNYGNHHFVGSGYLGSLASISVDSFQFKSIEPWMSRHVVNSSFHVAAVARRLVDLLNRQLADHTQLPVPASLYAVLGCDYMVDPSVRPAVSASQRTGYRFFGFLGNIKNYIFK